MYKNIDEVMAKMNEKKIELENQFEIVNSFKKKELPFTWKNFQALCETPLRECEELPKRLEEIFPFLKFVELSCNTCFFHLKDLAIPKDITVIVSIPTIKSNKIKIIINQSTNFYNPQTDIESCLKEIVKCKKQLNYTLKERINYCSHYLTYTLKFIDYLINWNKTKFLKRTYGELTQWNRSLNFSYIQQEKYNNQEREYKKVIEIITPFISQLLTFVEQVTVDEKTSREKIFKK